MKKRFWLIIFLLGFLSCTNKNYYYCENNNIYSITENGENDTLIQHNYYINGNVHFIARSLKSSTKLCGVLEEYYPDGFPQNRCLMSNGINIPPKEIGKYSGYDVKIDFGNYEILPNGRKVRPFRTFVDGISVYEYIVAVADTGGFDFLPDEMPSNKVKYVVYRGSTQDTNEVEIDETMYRYYIEDIDRAKMVNTDGDTCFLVYFYYKSVLNYPYPNDERMVVMHDSLNWEVTEFNKHYK
ncbi:MAG: hypothetical protein VZQ98_18725 [Bacteroidales bacterium]|nr:hypothetical protein [Bacteroidales bacterium]